VLWGARDSVVPLRVTESVVGKTSVSDDALVVLVVAAFDAVWAEVIVVDAEVDVGVADVELRVVMGGEGVGLAVDDDWVEEVLGGADDDVDTESHICSKVPIAELWSSFAHTEREHESV